MPRFDQLRRIVTVLLTAGLLLTVPQITWAGFSQSTSASLQASSALLVAPAAIVETHVCPSKAGGPTEDFSVTVTSFTAPGPDRMTFTYTYTLLRTDTVQGGTTAVVTSSSTARAVTLNFSQKISGGNRYGTYALRINAVSGSWVAPPHTIDLPC